MRFRQLLILIVLLLASLLTQAQTSPNFPATRTALAQQTQIRQGTRIFETPAEFQLTVTAQAIDATNTANANLRPSAIPTMEAQVVDTVIPATEIPVESEPFFGNSVLPLALLFFAGVLVVLGILGVIFYNVNQQQRR